MIKNQKGYDFLKQEAVRLAKERGQDAFWNGHENPFVSELLRKAWQEGYDGAKAGVL